MSLISLVSWLKRCESDKGRTQARGGNCKDCTMEVIQIYGKIQVARTADGCSSSSWFRCRKCSLVVRNHLVNQKKKVAKKHTYCLSRIMHLETLIVTCHGHCHRCCCWVVVLVLSQLCHCCHCCCWWCWACGWLKEYQLEVTCHHGRCQKVKHYHAKNLAHSLA